MTDDELRSLVAQNSQEIAGTRQNLNMLISDVITPMVERTRALEDLTRAVSRRTDELTRIAEETEERSVDNEGRSADNAELFRTLLAEAREDRMNNQKRFDAQQQRFDAQQEVIRSLLLHITNSNEETS